MTLEDWLKQGRSLADQLKVVEGLCSALNEGHQRGALHRGLDPANVEVASDGTCDLKGALSSGGSPRYRAPEIAEGASHSPQSDIYSAGVIFYEMLSGRSPSPDRPTPLADLRPDVPRDLTDAIMGCLERGPDWRPKDLSYLLQVVRTLRSQGGAKGGGRAPARAGERPAPAPRAGAPAARRPGAKAGSSSNLPLFVAAALLVAGAGAGAWFWFKGSAPSGAKAAVRRPPSAPVTTAPTAAPVDPPPVEPTPPAVKATPGEPTAAAFAADTKTKQPTPTPPPVTLAARPTPEPTLAPPEPAPATPTPAPLPAEPGPQEAVPAEPTVLTAVSPLQVKRGATTILDVRGTGLRADQKATVLKIKEAPNGISVVRQKFVNAGLVQVIVKLEETAAPGSYGLAMADTAGTYSNALSFTVAK
jgi:serine/threonine-protein kinase